VSEVSSRTKSRNRKKDTAPEMLLRRALFARGLRYRLHSRALPGNPDIVFPAARVAVFCDGDFWHGRNWEARRERLERGANATYWVPKIESNIARDRAATRALSAAGWVVLRLWETDIKRDPEVVAETIALVLAHHDEGGKRRRLPRAP
jgi:DNA mismatch endonuclease, patch repair protein